LSAHAREALQTFSIFFAGAQKVCVLGSDALRGITRIARRLGHEAILAVLDRASTSRIDVRHRRPSGVVSAARY